MKSLYFTLILLCFTTTLLAQKELQPYNYTLSSDTDKSSQTIMIYASAKSINSITFTLKNAKNETLKNSQEKPITFEVFPFTEVSFREHFFSSIKKLPQDKYNQFIKTGNDIELKNPSTPEELMAKTVAINNFRNVYQFFHALVITAFQYDDEPVSGVLKYNDSILIVKKNIQGLDADDYFKKQAKYIRKLILKNQDNFNPTNKTLPINTANIKGKHKNKKRDDFFGFLTKKNEITENNNNRTSINIIMNINTDTTKINKTADSSDEINKFTVEKDSYLWQLFTLHTNMKKGKNRNARKKLKDQIKKNIKQWYNTYELTDFITNNNDFFKKYFDKKVEIVDLYQEIKKLEDNIKESEKDSSDQKIKEYKETISKTQNDINFLIAQNADKIAQVPLWYLKISNIEIDFNDGFIEHITVTGIPVIPEIDFIELLNALNNPKDKDKYSKGNIVEYIKYFYEEPIVKEILKDVLGKELKFTNEFPIGFSSKTDFADLYNYELYAFEGHEKTFALPLANVVTLYVQRHQNDRLDFSPANQVVRLPLDDPDKNQEVELKKQKSYKILNARLYTDFNGLKESNPNGLIQIEVGKHVPLWTKRMDLGWGRSSNIGFANYADFNLTWAKVNEEDRELQVNYAESYVNNELQVDKYATYLDYIRHENISVGVDLNIASLDFPLIKTRVELNAGIHYGRVKVVDTLATNANGRRAIDKNVNLIRWYPDAIVRIRPEERFGGYIRFRPFKLIAPNNEEFFSVSSARDFANNRTLSKSWLHRYELGAFYTPSAKSDNKFFFRYRYTNTSKWETNGYSEFQLGYLFYLKF